MRATYSASTLGMHHISFCQGFEMVLCQAAADGLPRQAIMIGELDHGAGQQLQRPAGASCRRARTGGGDEESLLVGGQLAIGAGARLLAQGGFEIAFNEVALGPVDSRTADSDSCGNVVVAEAAVGSEQDLGSFELAGGVLAAADERSEFGALGFSQLDVVA